MKRLALLVALAGCGEQLLLPSGSDQLEVLKQQVYRLEEEAASLNSLIETDYASCPNSGETSDALIRKICQVAQASTIEARVEMTSQLQAYTNSLNMQISAINNDLATLIGRVDAQETTVANISGDVTVLQAQVVSILADISALTTRMNNAESAITALQSLTNSISNSIGAYMMALEIGEGNLSAGPAYETVLKRSDSRRFNGYSEIYGPNQILGNNPGTATNGSPNVVFSLIGHGFLVGDVVQLQGLTSGRGFSAGHLVGEFTIIAQTANTFTVTLAKNATSNGTLGNANGSVRKVVGRGMATLWSSGDPSDVSVRRTSLGSKRYNFLIRRKASDITNNTAELCFHKTDALASFATINAAPEGGSVSVSCQ